MQGFCILVFSCWTKTQFLYQLQHHKECKEEKECLTESTLTVYHINSFSSQCVLAKNFLICGQVAFYYLLIVTFSLKYSKCPAEKLGLVKFHFVKLDAEWKRVMACFKWPDNVVKLNRNSMVYIVLKVRKSFIVAVILAWSKCFSLFSVIK